MLRIYLRNGHSVRRFDSIRFDLICGNKTISCNGNGAGGVCVYMPVKLICATVFFSFSLNNSLMPIIFCSDTESRVFENVLENMVTACK